MEKVLLAIEGVTPDKKAFHYALELCLRIKAELKVLQIIRPRKFTDCLEKIKNTANQARQFLEDSMVAATFAEAGEHETADAMMSEALKNINKLIPESEKVGVPCHLTMKSGDPRKEIVNYVREHKGVVIAVYDAMGEKSPNSSNRKKKKALRSMTKTLSIPVVTIQADT